LATETHAKATLHQRAIHEFKELAIVFIYLYVILGAVLMYKTAILHSEGISFTPWGIAAVKAAVLAKFMLLGNAMIAGNRFSTRPLIWATLHKALALLAVLVIMSIIEEAVVGLLHHQSVATSLGELFGPGLEQFLAGILLMLLVLLPYCAMRVLSEALGEGRLARMFFVQRETVDGR